LALTLPTNNLRFRRLTDLYIVGQPLELPDGSFLWIQALNSYQRDEAVSDAQVARARLVMALRQDGDERLKVQARLYDRGRENLIDQLAEHRSSEKGSDAIEDMREDPEWKERMDILFRTSPEESATPMTHQEVTLLEEINAAVIAELQRREKDEKDFWLRSLERMTDEELIEEWTESWLDQRGAQLATVEFRQTEVWYATRYCNGVKTDDGAIDHSQCDAHQERVFPTRADVREAPSELITVVAETLAELNVAGRDPKGSGSPGSSSSSSPTPSEPEESMPSTSSETPEPVPGT
jgi:hypothetical protein